MQKSAINSGAPREYPHCRNGPNSTVHSDTETETGTGKDMGQVKLLAGVEVERTIAFSTSE